ncbi:MAG: spore cortex-lytic enzyme [Faecalibacterium sp.]|nr:spore cortex-lytic enzyme [Ruminococcus sp.]MCM1392418.1 spore cortex-lytic enzyme [Ruminococcus sp.]MCM1486415.1 spore cortex-lytic enzyme [Faecalibacterium sp.]
MENTTKKTKLKILTKSLLCVILALSLVFAGYAFRAADFSIESVYTLSKLGSRGDEVRKIQQKLKSLGYYTGSVDGIFGTATRNAVRAFQKNCGITVDGIAGPKTLTYLGLGSGSTSSSGSGKFSQSDINLLSKLIAAEARGEGYTGQVAVGAVVLNRVSHSSFPDTIAGVIYQKGAFSAVNDSNWSVAGNDTSRKAAQDCINGWDPSGGAIYYYNPKKTSNSFMLSRPVIKTIGNHIFCR